MDERQVDALQARLAGVCGQLNLLHAQLVDLVTEALENGLWAQIDVKSPEHWLMWQAGVSRGTARQVVALARARATHPAITESFAAGELTLDQAATAVKAPPHVDADIAGLSKMAMVPQLQTLVRIANSTTTDSDAAPIEETVTVSHDDSGAGELYARLDADHLAIVDSALGAARDRLFCDGDTKVTWVDALIDVCQRSLDGEALERRERFRINLWLDPTADIPATWTNGIAVPDTIRRYLTCDGTLTPTFVNNSVPVGVGRSQRIVPARTRRIVLRRDRNQCRAPWCTQTRWLDIHHIDHWGDLGETETPNLAALCRKDHRAHHRGEFAITGDADQPDALTFTDRNGNVITKPQPRPPDRQPPPPQPKQPYQHPLGERLQTRWVHFPPPPQAAPPDAA